jgi:hypothetical protein
MDVAFEPGGRPIVLPRGRAGSTSASPRSTCRRRNALAYRYRLDGYDSDWIIAGSGRRSVTYTNLAPGSRTRCAWRDRTGRCTGADADVRLAIVLRPAFYQTRWFAAGLFALRLRDGLRGAIASAMRQLDARSRELELVVAERTADLQKAYARIEEASLTDPVTGVRNRPFPRAGESPPISSWRAAAARTERGARAPRRAHLPAPRSRSLQERERYATACRRRRGAAADGGGAAYPASRASDYVVRWGGEEFLVVAAVRRSARRSGHRRKRSDPPSRRTSSRRTTPRRGT